MKTDLYHHHHFLTNALEQVADYRLLNSNSVVVNPGVFLSTWFKYLNVFSFDDDVCVGEKFQGVLKSRQTDPTYGLSPSE